MSAYQPKTGQPCGCRKGQERDNCPACEGTGQRIDFKAIRERNRCPYCGPGPCIGGPRTANGRDVEAFYRHHPRTA